MSEELKIISRPVISYCDIPEEIIQTTHLEGFSCDCYVDYEVTSKIEQSKYSDDFSLANWIIGNYPELEGQKVLIHIDY